MCKHPNRRRPTQPRPRPADLEIDRVERIDSTRLKIDRLDRSTRLASHFPLIFRCATSVEQRVFHRHVCLSVTTM